MRVRLRLFSSTFGRGVDLSFGSVLPVRKLNCNWALNKNAVRPLPIHANDYASRFSNRAFNACAMGWATLMGRMSPLGVGAFTPTFGNAIAKDRPLEMRWRKMCLGEPTTRMVAAQSRINRQRELITQFANARKELRHLIEIHDATLRKRHPHNRALIFTCGQIASAFGNKSQTLSEPRWVRPRNQ
jgi:hypothetical protein